MRVRVRVIVEYSNTPDFKDAEMKCFQIGISGVDCYLSPVLADILNYKNAIHSRR